ncbi:hypothetical protein [Bradyrhizobium sp. SBR1B]|nr:hypothetical protein [Bradyrhizobium sp. SBR1B]MBB4383672.1 hypothetical protein [Bradyrhizobium sp. SBR1B]
MRLTDILARMVAHLTREDTNEIDHICRGAPAVRFFLACNAV